jgi:probable rRNA maturation factor
MPLSISLSAPRGAGVPKEIVRRGVKLALQGEGHSEAQISVTFLDDDSILDLNRRWLRHDWVPDVLSFPLHPPGFEGGTSPPMGDVYVGYEQAARQAAEHGVPCEEEFVRLAIHGTLHILGYDHTGEEARLGTGDHFERQEELVRKAHGTEGRKRGAGEAKSPMRRRGTASRNRGGTGR